MGRMRLFRAQLIRLSALCLCFVGIWAMGCFEPYLGAGYYGDCSTDTDLAASGNVFEGAHCVDGKARCDNGAELCLAIKEIEGKDQILVTCFGPCLECPNDGIPCPELDTSTQELSYTCVRIPSECTSNKNYVADHINKMNCPTMNPSCL